ncbi:uncharacterized protein LOC142327793 isoform X2 [Lycorma delicatula]|uniref:uncharacterized protein LOC142327793 isoform X2 n=1 Tax=Lycorma delicatula TaxID=130591 RepID=UPI003F51401C
MKYIQLYNSCFNQFVTFLERLANVMSVDEITKDIGDDLHTESLLLRVKLPRLECDKLADKSKKVE